MIRPAQLRMARAGLKWTVRELAKRARVDKNTISRYEAGREVLSGTLASIERVLLEEGVTFIDREDEIGLVLHLPHQDVAETPNGRRRAQTRQNLKTKPKS